ncbi:hypothetical protein BDV12DRAFT_198703 [Aspergillus spectabilis]
MTRLSTSSVAILATALYSALGAKSAPSTTTACITAACAQADCLDVYTADISSDCSYYNNDGFEDYGYELNPAGDFIVYLNIPQPESGCQYIIGTGAGCGLISGRYDNAICVRLGPQRSVSAIAAAIAVALETGFQGMHERDPYDNTAPSHDVSGPVTGPADVQISQNFRSAGPPAFLQPWETHSELSLLLLASNSRR